MDSRIRTFADQSPMLEITIGGVVYRIGQLDQPALDLLIPWHHKIKTACELGELLDDDEMGLCLKLLLLAGDSTVEWETIRPNVLPEHWTAAWREALRQGAARRLNDIVPRDMDDVFRLAKLAPLTEIHIGDHGYPVGILAPDARALLRESGQRIMAGDPEAQDKNPMLGLALLLLSANPTLNLAALSPHATAEHGRLAWREVTRQICLDVVARGLKARA